MSKIIFSISIALLVAFMIIRFSHNYVGDNFNVHIPTWQIVLGSAGALGFVGCIIYWATQTDK